MGPVLTWIQVSETIVFVKGSQ